ncbi:MAG: hybrid sensor histidine kinase/response regulator [Nitrospirota bacterium]
MTTDKSSILIIDDDANLRKTLTDILTVKGYKTLAAENGAEGLSLLRQHTVHLALIDLRLPDISGLDVLNRIRADHPHTEAIILTGNATLDSAIEATNKGAFTYLQKPYDIDQLILHIRHAIEKQQADEKIRQYQEHLEDLVRERTAELEKEVTDRKCAEKEIVKLNEDMRKRIMELEEAKILADAGIRARGAFLANISHELITPLNSIIGFSQILLDGLGGQMNEQQRDYAELILQGGNRLHETLKEIVQFAGMEAGQLQFRVDRFLLNDLLKSSLDALKKKAAVQGVALSLEVGLPQETEIEADRGKLKQVLFNLLDNAVKFTPAGGSVRVAARLVDSSWLIAHGKIGVSSEPSAMNYEPGRKFVEVSVADTGIGIKEEDMPRLFQPFQQLESPYTKTYKGTGLGLMLAQELLKLHNGTIWAESEYGKGSKFTFVIPAMRGNL